MKKTYQLRIEGKHPDRLLDASKHDIRKYIRRERRKALPAGADYWDFDTLFGAEEASAAVVPPAELLRSIDALVATGGTQFYVEIRSKPGKRTPRPQGDAAVADPFDD
ncbi:hypothetical protein HEP73_04013 [Xanthomonas sp. GW]|uniref:DUF6172 family protein n=1 Tax=unclassified Xanthomonas TaxID=2643310 RepID=UPI001639A92A|nr:MULTISPECIES: DUF6172 family protein [unclassified Xanthomonas]QNH14461.1 hypothetical protein HEP75_03932 [Xanthomonas sp. SI]QNH18696.1 hypothetical protein HEP74_03870 [Xanthomonas sp. SS]QNH23062.1 hypothetical protein HEP73_04013 [Xanthomonas sp. GW]